MKGGSGGIGGKGEKDGDEMGKGWCRMIKNEGGGNEECGVSKGAVGKCFMLWW